MGYELFGTAFLRTHHPLKSFKPFNMVKVFLEISTKEIIQMEKWPNLYIYLNVYGRITNNSENSKQLVAQQHGNYDISRGNYTATKDDN